MFVNEAEIASNDNRKIIKSKLSFILKCKTKSRIQINTCTYVCSYLRIIS